MAIVTAADFLRKSKSQSRKKKGKKARRFNRPRSEKAKLLCAKRKKDRIAEQQLKQDRNAELREAGLLTPWEISKAQRRLTRHGDR